METNTATPNRWLHRFACLVAVCTFILVCAGGNVTSKGAGLAVPDWPLSYGQVNPPGWFEAENIRAEHGHRLIAGTVGVLMLLLAGAFWRFEPRPWVRRVAYTALIFVVIQALLGGLTVLMKLPVQVSTAHAALGQTFFCMTVALALFTSKFWQSPPSTEKARDTKKLLSVGKMLVSVVFIQLLLGAVMRHSVPPEDTTARFLSIPDFPLVYGNVLPPMSEDALHNINVDRFNDGLIEASMFQIHIHYAHRVWALMVLFSFFLVARRFKAHVDSGELLLPVALLAVLIFMQVILGVMVIVTGKHDHVTTAHVGVGATILATSVVLCLNARRAQNPAEFSIDPPTHDSDAVST